MTPERRAQLARGLQKNSLLPELLDERRAELRETWESADTAERREALWVELNALNNLKDFLYAKVREYAGDGGEK